MELSYKDIDHRPAEYDRQVFAEIKAGLHIARLDDSDPADFKFVDEPPEVLENLSADQTVMHVLYPAQEEFGERFGAHLEHTYFLPGTRWARLLVARAIVWEQIAFHLYSLPIGAREIVNRCATETGVVLRRGVPCLTTDEGKGALRVFPLRSPFAYYLEESSPSTSSSGSTAANW